jgi:hypothetical protein
VFALKSLASGVIQEYMLIRVGRVIKTDQTYSYMAWMSSQLAVAPAPGQNREWSLLFLAEANWLLGPEAATLSFRRAIPAEVHAGEALFLTYKADHGNDRLNRPHSSKKELFCESSCVSVEHRPWHPDDNIGSVPGTPTYEEAGVVDFYVPGQAEGGKDDTSSAQQWQLN